MIKRNDFWAAVLLATHVFLIQQVVAVGQNLLTSNLFRSFSLTNPALWLKIVASSLLVYCFFQSLFQTISIVSAKEDQLARRLSQALLALAVLISVLFVTSVFPGI